MATQRSLPERIKVQINKLNQFLDFKKDFHFQLNFKINNFTGNEFSFLMNSCLDKTNNKLGIAVDGHNLKIQYFNGLEFPSELTTSFSDTSLWHTVSISNNRGIFSALLDDTSLTTYPEIILSLPPILGFKIASNTANENGLSGYVDNILITDLRATKAQYPLNTGSDNIAYDAVGSYDGSITNGVWSFI